MRAAGRVHVPTGLILLAVLVGPLFGFAVYRLAVRIENEQAQALLEDRAATAAFAIDGELAAALEVLFAMRSHFDSQNPVTRARFSAAAEPFLGRHSCLQALEWAPRVGLDERRANERRMSDDGPAASAITERSPTGGLTSAGQRDWYHPVMFVEPLGGSHDALGFDLGSDQLRRDAVERAAASGEPALSDALDLGQAPNRAKGVLALLAVFEDGAEPTPSQRLPTGFFVGVIDMAALVHEALLGPGGPVLGDIHIELAEDDVDGQNMHLFSTPTTENQPAQRTTSAEWLIDAGGQHWRLTARPTAAFMKSMGTRQPLLLGTTSAVGWELMVGLIAILGHRTRTRIERRHARLINHILGGLSDGVIVSDRTGAVLMANRAATAVIGDRKPDLSPDGWSEGYGFFVPGTEELFPTEALPLARAIQGEAVNNVEVLVRNQNVPDGAHFSVSGAPIKNDKGALRGGVVVFRDTTERKRIEERLQRLSSAVEHTADSVMITDRSGTIEYVNPAFEATTGYSSAEAIGENPNILKSGVQGPEFYRELWETILRGEAFRGTTVNRKKGGELYHAEQTITAIPDNDGRITHFVSVLKDMTERRKIQHQEIELELASLVQQRLYPSASPQLPGYDLAGAVFPAEATCGDYFDFIPMANHAMAVVVADVSGHGLGPALVMAETRAYLRSLIQTTDDLAQIAGGVNRFLTADLQENYFVTMLLAALDPENGRLTYVNAAHPSGYIIDSSGAVSEQLPSSCLPLGLFPDRWRCETRALVLGPGELLLLVTDGVLESESPDGEPFDTDRLLEVVSTHRESRAEEIVERVYLAVRDIERGRTQMDDVTIVVCKRDPG